VRDIAVSAVLTVGLMISAAACTGDDTSAPSRGPEPSGEATLAGAAGGALAAAREGEADAEQLAALDDAAVTFAEYEAAVGRTLACMREAGIDVVGAEVSETRGFPEIRYSFAGSSPGRTDEQTVALADTCLNTHSRFVEGAYQTAPTVLEVLDARFEPYRAAIIECIRSAGGEVANDAGRETVVAAAFTVQESSGSFCLSDSGYQP